MNGPNQGSVDDAVWFHLFELTNSIGRAVNIDLVRLIVGSILEQLPISYGPWDMPLRIAHQAYQIARGLPMGTCPWVAEDFPWRSSTDGLGRLRKPQTHPSLTWYLYHGQTQARLSEILHGLVHMKWFIWLVHMIWFIWYGSYDRFIW